MVLHVFSIHYPDSRVTTMINKYFYEEYFVEPDVSDPKRRIKMYTVYRIQNVLHNITVYKLMLDNTQIMVPC